jgi:hypothetical protein
LRNADLKTDFIQRGFHPKPIRNPKSAFRIPQSTGPVSSDRLERQSYKLEVEGSTPSPAIQLQTAM